ncbi:MAG TPA: hypothetical protein PL009_15140 [Flavipsychrobacter sp.]|nr:hypothetical protein [Flavipsychrobacter sp.]
MGQRFLIDSNAVIDYLAAIMPASAMKAVSNYLNEEFITSIVIKIEVCGFLDLPDKMQRVESFLQLATAIVHNLSLLTRNIADFKNIRELQVVNPYEL